MSSRILIVEKTGIIKETTIKTYVEADLYKKAGFKSADGFKQIHQWAFPGELISLYGKSSGRAGQENKYDFPPPVDEILFFGSCILTSSTGSLKKTRWETVYEELFGGFEDVGEEDSEVSEDDDDDGAPRTKTGYVKDGFIVDDDEDEDEEEEEETEEEEDDEPVVKIAKPTKKGSKKAKQTVFGKIETNIEPSEKDDIFLGCTSELEEEAYEE
jgi:hypothetical protein